MKVFKKTFHAVQAHQGLIIRSKLHCENVIMLVQWLSCVRMSSKACRKREACEDLKTRAGRNRIANSPQPPRLKPATEQTLSQLREQEVLVAELRGSKTSRVNGCVHFMAFSGSKVFSQHCVANLCCEELRQLCLSVVRCGSQWHRTAPAHEPYAPGRGGAPARIITVIYRVNTGEPLPKDTSEF